MILLGSKYSYFVILSIIFATSFLADNFIEKSYLFLPLIISTIVSAFITKISIPILKELNINQIFRKEGPEIHLRKKGTPTMGGLLCIPAGVIIGNIYNIISTNDSRLHILSFIILSYTIIGFLDDAKSINKNKNIGLSYKEKLFLQIFCSLIFLSLCASNNLITSSLLIYGNKTIDIGLWIWPIAMFVLLAESNSTNLTDGLDGLASGCGALIFTGLAIEIMLTGNIDNISLANFCIVMAGTWTGFLLFNKNPAMIFMGDTGSLALGAALGGIALISNSLWTLFIMSGVFFIESLSVILQVTYFKLTKRLKGKGERIFLMTPLHHHFELLGYREILIVNIFWLLTICLVTFSLIVRLNY